jgi:hypothetical protein
VTFHQLKNNTEENPKTPLVEAHHMH